MVTLLTERGRYEAAGNTEGESLWLPAIALSMATGWELKPEGFCRDDICVPLPRGREGEFTRGDEVDAARLFRHAAQPLAASRDKSVWSFGTSAQIRSNALDSLKAPDIGLPDLAGKVHRISDHRGKKIFLSTWASW
ncbi:MAG: hypothetical protein FJX54_11660 [Alphaproteobacteria bacterium]|nr:hypothetical protein [Alphaproteobacteria bacterium]